MEEDDEEEGSSVRVLWVLGQHDGSVGGFVGGGDGGGFFFFFFLLWFVVVSGCGGCGCGCGGFFLL